jgi:RNA polymerase sigma-70 factor (ECF subfamily)
MYPTNAAPQGGYEHLMPAASSEDTKEQEDQRWAALMARAQQGEEQAYRALLQELAGVIKRYLHSRIGYNELIDDCVQDCLLAIHNARHTYDARRPFKPWLFAIVRYKAVDSIRRHSRQQTEPLDDSHLEALCTPAQELDNVVAQGQMIKALSPDYREAITLTKIIGLSTAEAASRLSISESTLKVRVHRAIKRLRRMLEAEEL